MDLLLLFLGSVVLLPLGMGIFAMKRHYSITLFVLIGLILGIGPFIMTSFTLVSHSKFLALLTGLLIFFATVGGFIIFITALCIRSKPKREPQVMLPMPLPPGQGE